MPLSISDDRENARLTQTLLRLDERDDLTPEEKALAEVLTLLIEDYEEKRYPMPRVSPNELLKALMEDRGIKRHLAGTGEQRRGYRNSEWAPVDQ